MSFLFPAFLFGALAIAIPIALHLWRRNVAPRVSFSDVRLLRGAPVVQARRRRLRELLLLALRVGAIVLLVLAFARPFLDRAGVLTRPATVIALDRSFSMGAPEVLAQARAVAVEAIQDAPTDHVVGLVAFDHRGEVAHDLTTDRAAVSAALLQVEPRARATGFAAGLETAAELIGGRTGRIVVVTDLQQSGWEGRDDVALVSGVAVEVMAVEAIGENLAVTAVQPSETGVQAVVFNSGRGRETVARLTIDDESLAEIPLRVPPGSNDVRFDLSLPASGTLAVSVDDPGGIPTDDRRYVRLDPPPAPVVGLVTDDGRTEREGFYLERVLQAGGESVLVGLSPADLTVPALSGLDALVLIGTQGLDRSGRERLSAFMAEGGGVLVVAGPMLDPEVVRDLPGAYGELLLVDDRVGAETSLTVTDIRHPVFRAFGPAVGTLGQVRIHRALRVAPSERAHVLARFADGGAALVEYTINAGRLLVFASDLGNEWNDFPRRPTFVPFVHEVTRYLVGPRQVTQELRLEEVPPDLASRPGPLTLSDPGRQVVVNVDPRESDLSVVSTQMFLERVRTDSSRVDRGQEASPAAAQEGEQDFWWYALLVMVLVLVAEAWLGRTTA